MKVYRPRGGLGDVGGCANKGEVHLGCSIFFACHFDGNVISISLSVL